MEDIEISIRLATDNLSDLLVQNELLSIYEELKPHGATYTPLESKIIKGMIPKSSDISIFFDSIEFILPAAVVVPVLTSLIKNYYSAKKRRCIEITNKKSGASAKFSGYDANDIGLLLDKLITTPATQTFSLTTENMDKPKNAKSVTKEIVDDK